MEDFISHNNSSIDLYLKVSQSKEYNISHSLKFYFRSITISPIMKHTSTVHKLLILSLVESSLPPCICSAEQWESCNFDLNSSTEVPLCCRFFNF